MNEKLKDEIRYYNKKNSYKIKYRKRKKDYALYLELHRKDIRKTINLNILVTGKVTFIKSDLKELKKANDIQTKKSKSFELKTDGASQEELQEAKVEDYILKIANSESNKSTKYNWLSLIKHISKFSNMRKIKTFKFKHIDKRFCEKFSLYLKNNLSPNTAYFYYGKFKQVLYEAVDDNILNENPGLRLKNRYKISKVSTKREYLTLDEIYKVYTTDFNKPQLKNAFVFSCFTGLRFVDVKHIKFEDIRDNILIFNQSKTDEPVRIKLHSTAIEIIEKQKDTLQRDSGLIFEIPNYEYSRVKMHELIKQAGIDKHITFHCGRHTFATMCLTYDIDIYTVSKLLGHKEIKNTQIYAKIIDKKRDQAIDKLPEL